MKNKTRVVLLLSILAAFMLLSGCTNRNSYVGCCVKNKIYDTSSNPLAILSDPKCEFVNGTLYGSCDKVSTALLGSTANCTQGTKCVDITDEASCVLSTTCNWSASVSPNCYPSTPATGTDKAFYLMPICQDAIPANCVNGRCLAMMCGYSGIHPGPLPAATDFPGDPASNPTVPASLDYKNEKINLQGTTCQIKTMDRKLYNQVKQSKGELWVNSFRFGVGKSFADYEQSRLFFPISDKFCTATPIGGKDRFVNYLNLQAQCDAVTTVYNCTANGLGFSTQSMCSLYCFGRDPYSSPPDCAPVTVPASTHFACSETKFVYHNKQNDNEECKAQCPIVSDPGKCSSSTADYPFLEPDLRFKYRLNGDYIYSSNTVGSDDDDGFYASCKQTNWRQEGGTFDQHYWCDDQLPWDVSSVTGSCFNDCDEDGSDRLWDNPQVCCPSETGHRQWMWWRTNRVFSLDIDYDYYKQKLQVQMPITTQKGAFECESSLECMSGLCDTHTYNRGLCTAVNGVDKIDCGCTKNGNEITCGTWQWGTYTPTGQVGLGGSEVLKTQVKLSPGAGDGALYYFTADPGYGGPAPDQDPAMKFLNRCDLSADLVAGYPKTMCLIDYKSLKPLLFDGGCAGGDNAKTVKAYAYKMNFRHDTYGSPPEQIGKIGNNCLLTDSDFGNIQPPYMQMTTYGWCQACTYSTLAVQKVEFNGAGANPGRYQCLDFRGKYSYSASDGMVPEAMTDPAYKYNEPAGPLPFSVTPVKKDYVTSGIVSDAGDQNGPIERGYYDQGWFGHDVQYNCMDGWDPKASYGTSGIEGSATGWHQISVPTQAYLIEKLRTYMQSNVMPVLDVRDASSGAKREVITSGRFPSFSFRFNYATDYAPLDICTKWGGDGSAIYVIGDYLMVGDAGGTYGAYGEGDGVASSELAGYFGDTWVGPDSNGLYPGSHSLNGPNAATYRALFMKTKCPNAPLIGVDIGSSDNQATLIGDKNAPGLLHKFFFKQGLLGYDNRVARGTPDKQPGTIDLLLQGWEPSCNFPGVLDDENRTMLEFQKRMNFSKALLSNFSKPSLIWQFHFPTGSLCNQDYFLKYLFQHQGEMVDSGVTGLIYDKWRTDDGKPYLTSVSDDWEAHPPQNRRGTTDSIDPNSLDPFTGASSTKTVTFCSLQNYSKLVMGLQRLGYGQKIYTQGSDACTCEPCSATDSANGRCISTDRRDELQYLENQDLPQLSCLSGNQCQMPSTLAPGTPAPGYSYYRCPTICASEPCERCDDAQPGTQAYCRVTTSDNQVFQTIKDYQQLSDTYWDIVGALPNQDKCCLYSTDTTPSGKVIETNYTYILRQGVKQRNEFLQFPRRGEPDIDCGRGVDTSVLSYCNVKVPLSDNHLYCAKIN